MFSVAKIFNLGTHCSFRDDDIVNELHHLVTFFILIVFAVLCAFKEFTRETIDCWNGAYVERQEKHYQDHINIYCWANDLYKYHSDSSTITTPYPLNTLGARDEKLGSLDSEKITFIRWATIIFLIQAFTFKLPNILWLEFESYCGTNMAELVEMMQGVHLASLEKRRKKTEEMVIFMEKWLRLHRDTLMITYGGRKKKGAKLPLRHHCMCSMKNYKNKFISTLFMVIKGLYLFVDFAQFIFLTISLNLNFWAFGVDVMKTVTQTEGKVTTVHFPMTSMCHFQVYEDGYARGRWVQCLLPINSFLEKIFFLQWCWFNMLMLVSVFSICTWGVKIYNTETAMKFVESCMKLSIVPRIETDAFTLELFVKEYLHCDGIFALHVLSQNSDGVIMFSLVQALWERYVCLKTAALIDSATDPKKKFFRKLKASARRHSSHSIKSAPGEQSVTKTPIGQSQDSRNPPPVDRSEIFEISIDGVSQLAIPVHDKSEAIIHGPLI